ncbi:phosphatase PAP2 family protein [Streptomyces sp. NPDC007126]|uniref:phosphatase PAP2 family protein n=1 Tax=Streptomyces TaxID=1883 RepID=UPI002109CA61|nr:phosphatase PAP2 family protein [Streptomyces coelicoflavus]MCQ4198994.1 phosphatase PAP2 family protein [Streptomyces coelicoflavus]
MYGRSPGGGGRATGRSTSAVLPPPLRVWFGPIALLAALVVVLVGAGYAGESGPSATDARIWAAVDGVGPPWRHVAVVTDFLGEPVGAVLLVAVLVTGCLLLRDPRAAVFLVTGSGLTVGTTTLLKPVVGRTIHGDNLSYPSGHTAFLTALALMLSLLATGRLGLGRAAGVPLVFAAGLVAGAVMGWAQVVLGSHYATDTLGGWCTAMAVLPVTAWLVDRTADRLTGRSTARTTGHGADRTADRPAERTDERQGDRRADAGRRPCR